MSGWKRRCPCILSVARAHSSNRLSKNMLRAPLREAPADPELLCGLPQGDTMVIEE